MKRTALTLALIVASATAASAQYNSRGYGGYGTGSNPSSHYVQPHVQRNGNYVGGHYQTNPNGTTLDNYGTRGNYNPYSGTTGRRGTNMFGNDD